MCCVLAAEEKTYLQQVMPGKERERGKGGGRETYYIVPAVSCRLSW